VELSQTKQVELSQTQQLSLRNSSIITKLAKIEEKVDDLSVCILTQIKNNESPSILLPQMPISTEQQFQETNDWIRDAEQERNLVKSLSICSCFEEIIIAIDAY
jgi:hypothetical protein